MAENKGEVQKAYLADDPNLIINDEFIETVSALISNPDSLREKLETINCPVVLLDNNFSVFEANCRFIDMLKYSREEILKLSVWDWDTLFTPEQIKLSAKIVQNTLVSFESIHKRKDGTLIDVEVNGHLFPVDNKVWQICLCRNLEEQKEIESTIQKYQHNLAETQRIAHIGSWELDVETGVFLCSDELKRIWEIPEDWQGNVLDAMKAKTHPDDAEKVVQAFQGSINGGHTL